MVDRGWRVVLLSAEHIISQLLHLNQIRGQTDIYLIPDSVREVCGRCSCLRSIPRQDAIGRRRHVAGFQSSSHSLCRYSECHLEGYKWRSEIVRVSNKK